LKRRTAWFVLVLLAALSLTLVALPVWIIQPFKAQTQQELSWSFAMKRWAIFATPLALVLSFALVLWLWRDARRWWRKTLLAFVLVPMLVATWFSRQNHFEWMFKPLPKPAYAKVHDAGFVTESDVVMAVVNNGEAAAYPVRLMAYHHLVHDVVGDTPIVATY